MTTVIATSENVSRRARLFQIGIETLERDGWKVERIAGFGKASVRRITKGGKSRKVSIRTTQDTWIAFPRDEGDKGWVTLSAVDVVLAVSVDDGENPRFAQVHWLEADEMRARFDRAYAARRAADYKIQLGRGMWVSLYRPEATDPVTHVGAGAGLDHPPIARVPLTPGDSENAGDGGRARPPAGRGHEIDDDDEKTLTIAEAKRRLAKTFGVDQSSITITVEA